MVDENDRFGRSPSKSTLLKIVILGDGGVGKSCLMSRFISNHFDDHSFHTIGVEFMNKTIEVNGKEYTLQVWDTAGQERFKSLRTPFYRGSDICILSYAIDDRTSFNNIKMWLNEFLHYAGVKNGIDRYPFMVVGNKMPDTEEKWRKIAKDFEERWQFPNCLGAIDGKHVRIIPPPGSGSYFWNYKNFNSIVLMACANANYEFIWCEVGTNGRVSDGGTIQNTLFYKKLQTKELNIPNDDSCQNSNTKLPFVFVGDEAFALRTDFMKPFSRAALTTERKIFNYRLSRARRIIENVFGIMSNRFRIFHSAINLSLDRIDLVVLTCCLLHNFLRKSNCPYATDNAFDIDSDETTATIGLTPLNVTNRNASTNAKNVREAFVQYFNGEGSVTWQYDKIA